MAEPKQYTSRRGGLITTVHSNRRMVAYVVHESELDRISALSVWATWFYSLASTFASFAFGLWSSLFIESSPTEAAKKTATALELVFAGLAVFFLVLGIGATLNRRSEVHKIKRESTID